MEKPRIIERYEHRKRIRTFNREYTERHRPLSTSERIEATRKILRFVEDNEDSLKEVERTADQDHKARGAHRRQSAFAATQFVFGETGFYPEQVAPVLKQMLQHELIDRSEDFTELRLTPNGRYLLEHYGQAVADPDFREELPWFEEAWEHEPAAV